MHLSWDLRVFVKAVINNRLVGSLKPKEKPFEVHDNKVTGFILRVQPTGRMTYVCQYARGKRVKIGSASAVTPAQARDRAKEILADVVKGADPGAASREAKAHNLNEYLKHVYSPWTETHHRDGAATIKRIRCNFASEHGKKKLSEITPWSIEKWRSQRLKGGTRPATINRDISDLKACLSRAVDWGFIKENPLGSVKPLKMDRAPKVRYLDEDEEHHLRVALDFREDVIRQERDSANAWREERGYDVLPDLCAVFFADHLKPMVILSLNTGLRRGELFNLEWPDIDIDRALLTIQGKGAKSGETRHIPLNEEAIDVLKAWRSQSAGDCLVFPGKNGARFSSVNSSWRALIKEAKIQKFRWHDMRHHFASRLVMLGVDLNMVRELLGHSDIKMTLRYAHLAPQVKAEAVAKLVRGDTWQQTSQISQNRRT